MARRNTQPGTEKGCGFWTAVTLISLGGFAIIESVGAQDWSVLPGSIVFIGIGALLLIRRRKRVTKLDGQYGVTRTVIDPEIQAEIQLCLENIREGKVPVESVIATNSPVILKATEQIVIVLPDIDLIEPRSVRHTSGVYGGPSFRIAKGMSFRFGAFDSRGESHDEMRIVDHGILTLTNTRLVFTGKMRPRDTPIGRIVAVEPYGDGIRIQASGRAKAQYYVGLKAGRYSVKVQHNDRHLSEPLTGLWIACIIEGLIKRRQ